MSISSFLASALAATLPLAGSIGPVDAQDQLAEPEVQQTAEAEQSTTGQSSEPGAHAEKGRITGDKEDVINGTHEEQSTPNLQSGKLAVQRELALATQELGHEFLNIDFQDIHSAHLSFLESFNPDTDQGAVDRVLNAFKVNGYDNLTANY